MFATALSKGEAAKDFGRPFFGVGLYTPGDFKAGRLPLPFPLLFSGVTPLGSEEVELPGVPVPDSEKVTDLAFRPERVVEGEPFFLQVSSSAMATVQKGRKIKKETF
jgi:hypothetical protein